MIPPDFFTWAVLVAIALAVFITEYVASRRARRRGYDSGYNAGSLAGRRSEREGAESAQGYDWLAHHSRILLRQSVEAAAKGHRVALFVSPEGYVTRLLITMPAVASCAADEMAGASSERSGQ